MSRDSNTERLIDQLANTIKLSDFYINSEGKLEVKEGHDPFADLWRDVKAFPPHQKEKAMARAREIIAGVMTKAKTRVLQQEGNRSRPASRCREPDSEEEQSSSKAQKPSPRSPPHPVVGEEEGEGKEGWPALPSPGGKVGPQVPILTPGSQKTPSPPKDPKGPKSPGAQPQPSTGANSPLKDSSTSKSPEHQPPPTPSQEAHKVEGLKSGLQKPGLSGKGPLIAWGSSRSSGGP